MSISDVMCCNVMLTYASLVKISLT